MYLLLKTLNNIVLEAKKKVFLSFCSPFHQGIYCIGCLSEVACVIQRRWQLGMCPDAMVNFQGTFGVASLSRNHRRKTHALISRLFSLVWKSAFFSNHPFIQYSIYNQVTSSLQEKKQTNKCTKNRAKSSYFGMIWRMWNGKTGPYEEPASILFSVQSMNTSSPKSGRCHVRSGQSQFLPSFLEEGRYQRGPDISWPTMDS